MIGSRCSISDLTSSTSYNRSVMKLSPLKSFLLIALWVFLIVQIFCHCVSTTIHDLVPTGAVCWKVHCKGVMIVPFVRWRLDISILYDCDIFLSFSANFFINSPISFLLTTLFLKIGEVGKVCLQMFMNFELALDVTKQLSTLDLLHEPFFAEMSLIGKNLFEDDFLVSHQFGLILTNCTLTFQ